MANELSLREQIANRYLTDENLKILANHPHYGYPSQTATEALNEWVAEDAGFLSYTRAIMPKSRDISMGGIRARYDWGIDQPALFRDIVECVVNRRQEAIRRYREDKTANLSELARIIPNS